MSSCDYKYKLNNINSYCDLVYKIAKSIHNNLPSHVQIDDLIQAGMIGLLEATKKFKADKGAKFTTFASIRVKGAIIDELRKGDWVPRSVYRNNRKIAECTQKIEQTKGACIKDEDIAKELNISVSDYQKMLQDKSRTVVNYLDDEAFTQVIASSPQSEPDYELIKSSYKQIIATNISNLPVNERLVLSLYYDEEFNLKQISKMLGVTESRVSQIHSQAIGKLRKRVNKVSS